MGVHVTPPSRVARTPAVAMMCGGMLERSGYQVRPFVVTDRVASVGPGPSRKMGSSGLVFELTCLNSPGVRQPRLECGVVSLY